MGSSFSDKGPLFGGVIMINFMKVVQCSNKSELELNITAVNSIDTNLKNTTVDKVCGELQDDM